ncbi:MAG: TIR domain-containing protein [Thermodesulfobacteriota bacterium]
MARKIFISYQHKDQMKAKGFNLLKWNKNVDIEFVGKHLLDPVDSKNEEYIKSKVLEQLKGTSVTVVLIGKETHESDWVKWEIEKSLDKDKSNGILAIRLEKDVPLSKDSPVGEILNDCGAEIIDWDPHEFSDAIERAVKAAGRITAIRAAGVGGGSCAR